MFMSFVRLNSLKSGKKPGARRKGDSARGFALIIVLLLMLLISAVSIGLMFMATNEGKIGGGDVQNNLAYHAAEGAIEKMTVDLASQMTNIQAPLVADINALGTTNKPADTAAVKYITYSFTATPDPANPTAPLSTFGQITVGPNDGLYAQVIPVQLNAVVETGMGAQVNMTRSVEIALIPAFQFGVFSQGDLGFYSSPNLTFNGRVHTNGDLYLGVSNGATVNFGDKISAYGNVIRTILPNGLSSTNALYNNNGTVLIPTASTGCLLAVANGTCRALLMSEGSIDPLNNPGNPPPQNQTPKFTTTSSLYNGYLNDGNFGQPGGTGAILLTMPFTGTDPNNPTAQPAKPFEIIRRPLPPALESPTSPVGAARLANQAQIRVLLSDTPQENHLDGTGPDADDVQLVSQVPSTLTALYSAPSGTSTEQGGVTIATKTYFFAEGQASDTGLVKPPKYHGSTFPGAANEWPLIDGWLRVEYKDAAGTWHPATNEWLALGFARDSGSVPQAVGANPVHLNAILIFEETKNTVSLLNPVPSGSGSQYQYYPINFYDAREGELRDVVLGTTTAAVNGIMNAVELDVGNLRQWITTSTNGKTVDYVKENGYILYFSDRRGMLPNPNNGNVMQGEYGFEDTINTSSGTTAVPDGTLEPPTAGCPPANPNARPVSPEDVNGNCRLDNYGATNVGDGFGVITNTAVPNPYLRADAINTARKNRVTGARHVLKLIDGGLGNLPTRLDNNAGGFTVAAENPVYIFGNYNTNASDTTWNIPPVEKPHAAAAVIADAVTLLSSVWQDSRSFNVPSNTANRPAATTSYRVAIAAGKNLTFPAPNWITSAQYGYGTDGGVHNFLRFLEDWGGQTLNYKGSMVSLYYATYNTGAFKCCNSAVYHPPARNYQFDELFITAGGLPPGTPMFRDVNNLSFRQDFTPQTSPTSTPF